MSAEYLDLDVIITGSGENYTLLLDSAAGDKGMAVQLPLAQLRAEAEQLERLTGWEDPAAEAAMQRWGEALYQAIFGASQGVISAAKALARERRSGVRLRVRSDDPAIQSLPWEYLHDGYDFLALDRNTPLVRYLHVEQARPTLLAEKLPLRLLVALALPTDVAALDVEQEWERLYQALEPLVEEGLLEVVVLPHATRERLNDALQDEQGYQMLHFVGHGAFDAATGRGSILLEDEEGRSDRVADGTFALWVQNAGLKLVFLNACDTARTSPTVNRATGVAQRLVMRGVGAVIAHQFPIEDRRAMNFATTLYKTIASGRSVEAAVSVARAMVADSVAWGTPVLFLRADDGRLFNKAAISPEEKAILRQAGLWRRIQDALLARAWGKLVEKLETLCQEFVSDSRAQAELRKYREADGLIEQAAALLVQGNSQQARLLLGQAKMKLGKVNYRDLEAKIREADAQKASGAAPGASAIPTFISRLSPAAQRQLEQMRFALQEFQLVPFLGGEANLSGRDGLPWSLGSPFPPTPQDLAEHLASRFPFPDGHQRTLARVAQYMAWMRSESTLYRDLTEVFVTPLAPTPLHRLMARVAGALVNRSPSRHQHLLFISSNYDSVLEESLTGQGVPYHLLTYEPEPSGGGRFRHTPPGGDPATQGTLVLAPNKHDLDADGAAVVIKLNGGRVTTVPSSVLVTEDQFIEYAPREEIQNLLPHAIKAQLAQSHFLFLGYSLQDWPVRLILNRMGNRQRNLHAWAVVDPALDTGLIPWESVGAATIRQVDCSLDEWVEEVEARLRATGDIV